MTFALRIVLAYYAFVAIAIIGLGLALGGCASGQMTRNGWQEQPMPKWSQYHFDDSGALHRVR